jgi:hypothetical protein
MTDNDDDGLQLDRSMLEQLEAAEKRRARNAQGRSLEPPKEYGKAWVQFYFKGTQPTQRLRYKLWEASHASRVIPGSPFVQDLCEGLFLEPLRRGDHGYFRTISEQLEEMVKNMELGSDRPPDAKIHADRIEHYVFLAFQLFRGPPLALGKWPTWNDVKKLARRMLAKEKLVEKGILPNIYIFDLSPEQDKLVKQKVKTLPRVRNWREVQRTCGLGWL